MTTDTLHAPAAAPAPTAQFPAAVALDLIVTSPTNPRRHHSDAALEQRRWRLDEMAASIRKHGVMQPVLLRPNPAHTEGNGTAPYELVAGERRLRASRMAEQAAVPALVRRLTDLEVLELQVIENIQREDLNPIEEADGFRRLLDVEGGYSTAGDIAARLGKSERWVYNRLRLLTLCDEAQQAVLDGTLNASVALEIAEGVPDLAEQRKHTKAILSGWGGEPFSARQARKYLRDHAMLRLDRAKFDARSEYRCKPFTGQASYYRADTSRPLQWADVGPCTECPKRTGAKPDFFDDVKEGDLCQDASCFQAKTNAVHELVLETAREQGSTVLSGPKARKLLPHANIRPDGFWFYNRPAPEMTDRTEPLDQLVTIPALALVVVENASGDGVETLAAETYVRDALSKAGLLRKATPAVAKKPAPPKKARDGGGSLLDARSTAAVFPTRLDPVDPVFDQALAFRVLAEEAMEAPGAAEQKRRAAEAEQRATALIIGRAVSKELRREDAEDFPSTGLSRAILVLLAYGDAVVSFETAVAMLELEPPAKKSIDAISEWALALDDEAAARLSVLLIALQDAAGSKAIAQFPAIAAQSIGLDPEPLIAQARELVRERLQLELLALAKPAAKSAKGKPEVKYRHPKTGTTWSGRGLRPAWLKEELAGGAQLSDFEVGEGGQP